MVPPEEASELSALEGIDSALATGDFDTLDPLYLSHYPNLWYTLFQMLLSL